jgi:hypothetical protein
MLLVEQNDGDDCLRFKAAQDALKGSPLQLASVVVNRLRFKGAQDALGGLRDRHAVPIIEMSAPQSGAGRTEKAER